MGVGMDGKDVAEAVAAVAAMMGKIQNPKVKAAARVVLQSYNLLLGPPDCR